VTEGSFDPATHSTRSLARSSFILLPSSFYFDDPRLVHTWLDPYRAAAAADLARVAAHYLVPENRVTSLFVAETGTRDRGMRYESLRVSERFSAIGVALFAHSSIEGLFEAWKA